MHPSRTASFGGLLAVVALSGCDLTGQFDGVNDLTGQNAFVHLQPISGGEPANMGGISDVIDVAVQDASDGGSSFAELSSDAYDIMASTAMARESIETDGFQRIDLEEFFGPADPPLLRFVAEDLDLNFDEYIVPGVESIPVRNQKARGTCASFAGIGTIEHAIITSTDLPSIDLSEQHFYWLSKPSCQDTPCGNGGSTYWRGMWASEEASSFDLPLESDCTYSGKTVPGNETQIPLDDTCFDGVAKVQVLGQTGSAQDIIDALEDGYIMAYGSALSRNWERNSGLITLEGSGWSGETSHASGHAYQIVGYRELPDMPEEGGMCFIIKNSWGPGWGVDGYSCMTLAWAEAFGHSWTLPLVEVVDIDLEKAAADIGADIDIPRDDDDVNDDPTIDRDDDVVPSPVPGPEGLEFTRTQVVGADGATYAMEVADSGDQLAVRGVLRGTDGGATDVLYLDRGDGAALEYDGIEVGAYRNGNLKLCTARFDVVCSLRLDGSDSRLYIETRPDGVVPVNPEDVTDGDWAQLVKIPLVPYKVAWFKPDNILTGLFQPAFVRLESEEAPLDPMRISIRGTDIKVGDRAVGSINPTNFALCSGSFKDECKVAVSDKLWSILPGW